MTDKKVQDKRIKLIGDSIREGVTVSAEDKKFLFGEGTLTRAIEVFNSELPEDAVKLDPAQIEVVHQFEADLEPALVYGVGRPGVDAFKEHSDLDRITGELQVGGNKFLTVQKREYNPRNSKYHPENNPDVPERLSYLGRVDVSRDVPINNQAYKRSITSIYDYASEILG